MTRAFLSSKVTKSKTSNGTSFVPSTATSSRDSLATMVNPSQAWVVPLSFSGSKVSPTKPVPNPGYAEMLDEDNMAWGGAPTRRWWKRA
ncbi:hypothetical protein DENSPDRAFT_883532 [Dentipellis sp. KUC8613]|nr:hypothetical protein DENSPDRAFT_883532 [Dentipellis sp. KUC8613]